MFRNKKRECHTYKLVIFEELYFEPVNAAFHLVNQTILFFLLLHYFL